MSVSLAGGLLQDPSALSPPGRLVLAFLDGGPEWLDWAIGETRVRYEFPDETTLVGQVHAGLRGGGLALLPRLALKVHPVKLMSIGLPELRLLARREGGDDGELLTAQIRQVLADHRLATCTDLALVPVLLDSLGVAGNALFHAMDFDDHLALWQLACDAPAAGDESAALPREAATWAVQQARTPIEFCDYYRVYVDCASDSPSASPQERAAMADAVLRCLLPLIFSALDGPQVNGLPSPADVEGAVASWLARGRQIGFARLSQAVQQIVRHTSYRGESGDAAPQALQLYMDSAQAFLAANRLVNGRLGQDGATCFFTVAAGRLRAELQVGADGVISLRDFGPQSSPAPSIHQENL